MAGTQKSPQVVMAKTVARRWLNKVALAEYRIRVFYGARDYRNLPNLLRAFRDGKAQIAGLSPVSDMGVKEEFDYVEVWSKDYAGMLQLGAWFERQKFDTTGIW
jgi:hypothetical protein